MLFSVGSPGITRRSTFAPLRSTEYEYRCANNNGGGGKHYEQEADASAPSHFYSVADFW